MILLKPEYRAALQTASKENVLSLLQKAVELEHSTIPLYLYTMYSLKPGPMGAPGPNDAIAEIIQSVVIEEMLHMNLACNVLNALGGSPKIDGPDFIPKFPGPLPGGVESQLTVHLAPYSQDQVSTFMDIEEPVKPLEFPVLELASVVPGITIGEFYTGIQDQIRQLGDSAFTGDPMHQVKGPYRDGMIVTNVDTAVRAIDIIIDQGEGASPDTPLDLEGELSHYYRFAELYHLRTLIKNPEAGPDTPPDMRFLYAGAKIPFDPAGVFQVPKDPSRSLYKEGSAEIHAVDSFNYTYTSLLKGLHALFNGETNTFPRTLGAMMSLRQQAIDMMSGLNLSHPVGPSFEYQPVNPAGK